MKLLPDFSQDLILQVNSVEKLTDLFDTEQNPLTFEEVKRFFDNSPLFCYMGFIDNNTIWVDSSLTKSSHIYELVGCNDWDVLLYCISSSSFTMRFIEKGQWYASDHALSELLNDDNDHRSLCSLAECSPLQLFGQIKGYFK